jgi:hypothetical protein
MKIDPSMHIGLHLVFFGKTGVTKYHIIKIPLSKTTKSVDPFQSPLAQYTDCSMPARRGIQIPVVRGKMSQPYANPHFFRLPAGINVT